MKRAWVFARREVETSLTERTLLVALAIQIFVAGFSSFLVVGLASLVDPSALPGGTDVTVAMVGDGGLGRFLENAGVNRHIVANETRAMELFNDGAVDAVVIVEEETAWNATDPLALRLIVPEGNLRATFTVATLKEALTEYESTIRQVRADRLVDTPPKMRVSGGETGEGSGFEFIYTLLIPLLVFLPVVLSGALVADAFTEEIQRGTLGILLSTPATLSEVVGGKLLGNAVLAPLLAGVWLGLLKLNGIDVVGIWEIMAYSTLAALVFGALACVVGLATGDRHKAHLVYAGILFLLVGVASLLPQSPVNLIARFAAGAADGMSYTILIFTGAATLILLAALVVLLDKQGLRILAFAERGRDGKKEKKQVEAAESA